MTLHRTQSDAGWIKRRFLEIDRKIERLSAARRLESATIGKGGLKVRLPGDLQLVDAGGLAVWSASTDPIKTGRVFAQDSGLSSIPTTWTPLGYGRLNVPAGYVGTGHFMIMASVGDSMAAGEVGSVSAQPLFRWVYDDNSTSGWFGGPAIASAENRITVAQSFWASNFTPASNVAAVDCGVNGVRSFGREDPGNGNWHVAASVMFKRGEAS